MFNKINKVLIVGCTHGHEKIGLKVIEELKKLNIDKNILCFEVGNPKAEEKNVPFIESDLNRVFPGKNNGTYEEIRAYQLLSKIKESDLVIDIHSTNTTDLSDKSMLIVTNYNEATKEVIDIINPPKVLYMKYKSDKALISNAKIGIAFEYGKDTSDNVLNAILYDITEIFLHYKLIKNNPYSTIKENIKTETFEVYDVFLKDFYGRYDIDSEIRNFKMVYKNSTICEYDNNTKKIKTDEDFIPVLFGENRYTEILGFKARIL